MWPFSSKKKKQAKKEAEEKAKLEKEQQEKAKQQETKKAEPVKTEPKKAEVKPEPKKAEPVKAEQKKVEPKKAEPAKPAPKKEEKPEQKKEEKPVEDTTEKEEVVEDKARKAVYRVLFDKEDGLWKIKKDGAKRIIDSFKTKDEALTRVQELSKNQDSKFVVYKKDGKFQKKANLNLKNTNNDQND